MSAEHDDAVEAARAHLSSRPDPARPLRPLPAGFAATREALHYVAEQLVKPKRELETGNEIALGFTPGGFGTPIWDRGVASGTMGRVRVEGAELVLDDEGEERRVPAGELRAGAELLGVSAPGRDAVDVDAGAVAALADWYAFGTVVLAELIDRRSALDPAPIRLWPEHFDVATELGSEVAGTRATYGASPGDDDHPEPYLYVSTWDQGVSGEPWNATAFVGAEMPYGAIAGAGDQIVMGLEFMEARVAALSGG
jgi:hypothetical protein